MASRISRPRNQDSVAWWRSLADRTFDSDLRTLSVSLTGQRYRQGLLCASSPRNSTFDSRFSAVTTSLATPKLLVALLCADGNINPGELTTRTDVLLLCTAPSPCYCRRHKILRSLARSAVQTPMTSRTAKAQELGHLMFCGRLPRTSLETCNATFLRLVALSSSDRTDHDLFRRRYGPVPTVP
jgi:hypothetical protein